MNVEDIRKYCIQKKGVTESFPFNDTALVFKVAGKMFALLDLSESSRGISLKCDPGLAVELREKFPEVTPGYHFNKKHWNSVDLINLHSEKLLYEWIDHSYDIVVQKLTNKQRMELL